MSSFDSNSHALLAQGIAAHQAGRIAQAVEAYEQALVLEPQCADALHLLGVAHFQSGDAARGAKLVRDALVIQPQQPLYHNNLGNMLRALKEGDAARDHYRRAVDIKPDYAQAHNNLATALQDDGRLDEAQTHYECAVALDPSYAQAQANLGGLFRQKKNMDAAASCYMKALTINPALAQAANDFGNMLFEAGQFEEAADLFARALRYHARHPVLRYSTALLSFMKEGMSNWSPVCRSYLREVQDAPVFAYEMQVRLAIAAWLAGDRPQAAAEAKSAHEIGAALQSSDKNTQNMRVYERYIARLLTEPVPPERIDFSLIGDSHALSYAPCVREASLVVGAKAWHFAQPQINQYKACFLRALDRLPSGDAVILSFGEIDCRVSEGILPYARKTGRNAESVAQVTADAYARYMCESMRKRGLHPIFLNVPAAHLAALPQALEDTEAQRTVIHAFNKALQEVALDYSAPLIDMHRLTDGADGRFHIDAHHLKPEAFMVAYRFSTGS